MERLRGDGFEIRPGKTLAFRWPGQERFIRLCSLGEGYDESELRAALRGDVRENPFRSWASKQKAPEKLSLLIDIQEKLKAGKGPDYERWANTLSHCLFILSIAMRTSMMGQLNQLPWWLSCRI